MIEYIAFAIGDAGPPQARPDEVRLYPLGIDPPLTFYVSIHEADGRIHQRGTTVRRAAGEELPFLALRMRREQAERPERWLPFGE